MNGSPCLRRLAWTSRNVISGINSSSTATRQAIKASWNGWDSNRKKLIKSGPNSDNPHGAGGTLSAPPPFGMNHYSISKIARACGLSRSTLLYYDRIGLLRPSGRTASGYRYYTDADRARLQRVRHFREAGLTLKEIRAVLSSGCKPGTKLLERRLRETAENIVGLKNQQRMLARMLRQVAAGKRLAT